MGTKRIVSPADKAKFFAAIAAGKSITDASRMAGVHVNTGSKWLIRLRAAQANSKLADAKVTSNDKSAGSRRTNTYNDFMDAIELPTAIEIEKLSVEARKGYEDFGFFREYVYRTASDMSG